MYVCPSLFMVIHVRQIFPLLFMAMCVGLLKLFFVVCRSVCGCYVFLVCLFLLFFYDYMYDFCNRNLICIYILNFQMYNVFQDNHCFATVK